MNPDGIVAIGDVISWIQGWVVAALVHMTSLECQQ
jgi:hypothetical protein